MLQVHSLVGGGAVHASVTKLSATRFQAEQLSDKIRFLDRGKSLASSWKAFS